MNLSKSEKERLLKEVQEEFPEDLMMQEIHYIRLLHHYKTEKLSKEKRIKFYKKIEKTAI
ncbi:MAG: hypothetical protein HWN67_00675 [Candidatus Helarchaeota archaeon]|nr:hypothetical protein [Candidatus Helarchaeota archaeon]